MYGPYIFSYGSFSEEDCFKLWDKNTFQCVASYTLDHTVSLILQSALDILVLVRPKLPISQSTVELQWLEHLWDYEN